jgi:hypothetical protein
MRWAAEKTGQRMRGGQTNIYICKTADTREATFEEGDMAYIEGVLLKSARSS